MKETQETQVQPLCWEDSPRIGNSNIHAWKIPWTEKPGGLPSRGSQRVRHDWALLRVWTLSTHFLSLKLLTVTSNLFLLWTHTGMKLWAGFLILHHASIPACLPPCPFLNKYYVSQISRWSVKRQKKQGEVYTSHDGICRHRGYSVKGAHERGTSSDWEGCSQGRLLVGGNVWAEFCQRALSQQILEVGIWKGVNSILEQGG